MRIESAYKPPIHGVSTLAPRSRAEGQAEKQVNFRSDPVNRLTRRPPMKWVKTLLNNVEEENVVHHFYRREDTDYRLILDKSTGKIYTFVDNEPSDVLDAPEGYIGANMKTQTVENTTYFINTDKTILMTDEVDRTNSRTVDYLAHASKSKIASVSYVNVTTALNYGETVRLEWKSKGPQAYDGWVSWTVPDVSGTNYAAADRARSTNQVALQLTSLLNESPYVRAKSFGSVIAIYWMDSYDNEDHWHDIQVSIATGQGDRSCIAFNSIIESVEGLPKYAIVGTRIEVRPNPTSEKGKFYLNATAVDGSTDYLHAGVAFIKLEEVVWTESYNPLQPYKIDNTTTPFTCKFKDGSWSVNNLSFKNRKSGDDESNKLPKFINDTITSVSYIQKRLVFLTGNNVVMSETDDELNFWRQSAVQLLVNDAVSVSSSAAGIDKLTHVTTHNKDLLVIASNGQFKINGSEAITPQTISMPMTTNYECQVKVEPVSLGSTVLIPIDYGVSTGIQEYSSERNKEQDFALPITTQVIGYMKGEAKLLAASTNLEMVALITDQTESNKIFIFDQFTDQQGRKVQNSWSEWELSSDDVIIDMHFTGDRLNLLCSSGGNIIVKEVDMYSKVATGASEVYLDDILELETDGITATLPDNYSVNDLVAVRGEGTDYKLNLVGMLIQGRKVTFDENIGAGKVLVGRKFTSMYTPTRPFIRDGDGYPVTTNPLRISKFILDVVDTNTLKMNITTNNVVTTKQVFSSKLLGQNNSTLGDIPFHTGTIKFPFSQNAEYSLAEFVCDNHLGCTITNIGWEGKHFQSKRRI